MFLSKEALRKEKVRSFAHLHSLKTLEELVRTLGEYESARRRFQFENVGDQMRHSVHTTHGEQDVRFGNKTLLRNDLVQMRHEEKNDAKKVDALAAQIAKISLTMKRKENTGGADPAVVADRRKPIDPVWKSGCTCTDRSMFVRWNENRASHGSSVLSLLWKGRPYGR